MKNVASVYGKGWPFRVKLHSRDILEVVSDKGVIAITRLLHQPDLLAEVTVDQHQCLLIKTDTSFQVKRGDLVIANLYPTNTPTKWLIEECKTLWGVERNVSLRHAFGNFQYALAGAAGACLNEYANFHAQMVFYN